MSRFVQSKVECDLSVIIDASVNERVLLQIAVVDFYAGVSVLMICHHASGRWYTERRRSLFSFYCRVRCRANVWSRKRPLGSKRNADMVEERGSANDGSNRIVIVLARCYVRI